ncbi:MAG: hypothetical protein AAGI48_09570 [Verrucomicrobiota bacterium]
MKQAEPVECLEHLRNYCEDRSFAGWDPYDALNSPFMPVLSLGTKYGRIAWTQLLRRLPLNLRPLLRVPHGHNPKGLGLFLGGYAKIHSATGDESCLQRIDELLALLRKLGNRDFGGIGWGYNFPWQNRVMFVPRYTPTVVNTSFIGHALIDCAELAGRDDALELASAIPAFFESGPNRLTEGENFCFSYTPLDENYVHNANMLSASLLLRLGHKLGDDSLRDTARRSMAYSMSHQHEDGSWYYAEAEVQHWYDSFHTGFNLEALRWFMQLDEACGWQDGYRRGVDYYAESFFLEDGTPKYYDHSVYPIDIHSPAEAICFFSGEKGHEDLVKRVTDWMLRNLWDQDQGYFYFRKTASGINRIPYMRWSESWAFRALTDLIHNQRRSSTGSDSAHSKENP